MVTLPRRQLRPRPMDGSILKRVQTGEVCLCLVAILMCLHVQTYMRARDKESCKIAAAIEIQRVWKGYYTRYLVSLEVAALVIIILFRSTLWKGAHSIKEGIVSDIKVKHC